MKDCKNKEAAYEVLRFMLEDENIQIYLDEQNAVPCKEGDFELPSMLDGVKEYIENDKMTDYQDHHYPSEMAVDAMIQTYLMDGDADSFLAKFDKDWIRYNRDLIRKVQKYEEEHGEGKRTFMLITIPVLILFFAFNTLPLIKGFIYSFTNFKGYGSYEWVGLRNYIDLFQDARVGKSYLFTFKFAIVATIIVNVISLILALGLNSKIRAKSALRGIYFIPNVLGGLVVGYIFSFIFTYILPTIGENLGIGFLKSSMLASTKSAWFAIVIVAAWQAIAMNTIIYISGLQTVPEDVYEAGAIDGATGWSKFKNLTFPLIIPFFTINMVLCMKNFLMVFDQIMSLTKGGPAQSTESISYLIYRNGMDGGQFGFQSANAVLFFVVIVAISVFQLTFMNKKEEQL